MRGDFEILTCYKMKFYVYHVLQLDLYVHCELHARKLCIESILLLHNDTL